MNLYRSFKLALVMVATGLVAVTVWWAPADTATAEPAGSNQTCLACHSNQVPGVPEVTWETIGSSVHAGNSCIGCHSEQSQIPHNSVGIQELSQQVSSNCQVCHEEAGREFQNSIHSQVAGITCATCHGDHNVLNVDDPSALVARKNVVSTCNSCHGDSNAASSYAESFHGKAVSLGGTETPTCATCHGSHQILAASNPSSRVAAANLPQICAECHRLPQANFAAGNEHFELAPVGAGRPMFYTFQFFTWLTIIAMALLIIHIELELWRQLRQVRKKRTPESGEVKE